MSNPLSIESVQSEIDLIEARRLHGPAVNMIKSGVCALIIDAHSSDVFYARHHAKEGYYPNDSIGTSSETFRWVPHRANNQGRQTETALEAFLRSLHEELGLDREGFMKAGFHFNWANPVLSRAMIDASTSTDGSESLDALSFAVMVDNPEALIFSSRTSEEILSTGFAPIEEIDTLEPFRPGFKQWFNSAHTALLRKTVDVNAPQYLEWIEPRTYQGTEVDVSLGHHEF